MCVKAYFQRKFINFLVKRLFNAIEVDDVLRIKGDDIYCKGRKIPDDRKSEVLSDANRLVKSKLWQYLCSDARYQANKKMYYQSQKFEDVMFGKAALWTIYVLEERLRDFVKYGQRKP